MISNKNFIWSSVCITRNVWNQFISVTQWLCQKEGDSKKLRFKKRHMFKCEIYMYRSYREIKIVKIRAPWPRSFLCANILAPLRAKKNCLEIEVYCMQKKRIGNTVPMHQTISLRTIIEPLANLVTIANITKWRNLIFILHHRKFIIQNSFFAVTEGIY